MYLRREKRFSVLVDVDGERVWAHTNNTGSMLSLLRPGCGCLVSPANNPARKLKWTLEALERPSEGTMASVNTLAPNRLLKAAWEAKALPELAGCDRFKSEAAYGDSRLDARLEGPDGTVWVEAKNVTLCPDGAAIFPDAPSPRAQKHVRTLMELASQGARVAVFYVVSMAEAQCFGPAACIDPDYARLFYQALEHGVEAWPYLVRVEPDGLHLDRRLPVRDNQG